MCLSGKSPGEWGVSARWVVDYIQQGRIPGVERFGKVPGGAGGCR